jgi:hypothetical protein
VRPQLLGLVDNSGLTWVGVASLASSLSPYGAERPLISDTSVRLDINAQNDRGVAS